MKKQQTNESLYNAHIHAYMHKDIRIWLATKVRSFAVSFRSFSCIACLLAGLLGLARSNNNHSTLRQTVNICHLRSPSLRTA